jgi:hypothetical protein
VGSCRVKFAVHLLTKGESAEKISWWMIGIVWDYVWELSDPLYFIKLFPICQPLSPTRREGNKSIPIKPKEKFP